MNIFYISKEQEQLQQAWHELFMAFVESIGMPKFLRWLNSKLSKEVA